MANPIADPTAHFATKTRYAVAIALLVWASLGCARSALAQDSSSVTAAQPARQQAEKTLPGIVIGRVVDPNGAVVTGARVRVTNAPQLPSQEALTDEDGRFSIFGVDAGPFTLEISAADFATRTISGSLPSGETYAVPQVILAVATETTEVHVTLSPAELAEEQIKEEEKQRIVGVFPNFYVTYVRDAAPLTPKQKFELAWKSTVDPVNFVVTGVVAGFQQAQNDFSGYGQGSQGYAKRYGAAFGDSVTGTFLGGAILPTLLKQDPRYFYKGEGSVHSRLLYALANALICKGDNGRWQPNYSSIIGNLAAGGISNLYYPTKDRNGAGLTVETALIGLGATAATNILQEFVIKRFTPAASNNHPQAKTQGVIAKVTRVSNLLIHDGD